MTKTERPLLTFVHVTDTHADASATTVKNFVDCINRETYFPLPDLVLHTGDLINGYVPEKELYAMMRGVKTAVDKLRVPWMVACHNHDTHGETVRGTVSQDVFQVPLVQEVQIAHCYFLMFSGSVERAATFGGLPTEEGEPDRMDIHTPTGLKVLRAHLHRQPVDVIKCVFSHEPLFCPRKEPGLADPTAPMPPRSGYRYGYSETRATPVRRILEHYRVTAHYCGHVHVNGRHESNGVQYVLTGALRDFPGEFRHVSVFPDRMEHRMYGIPGGGQLPKRWSPHLVDADHLTPDQYFAGLPWEREFTIPLPV